MTEITPEALEALSKKAEQTEDDIRYYSGGSKYNEPLEQLKDRLVHLYRTGQLIHVQPSGDVVEAVARAINLTRFEDDGSSPCEDDYDMARSAISTYEAVSGVAKMREALRPFAQKQTVAEALADPTPPAWAGLSIEERMNAIAENKAKYDAEILAARAALGEKP